MRRNLLPIGVGADQANGGRLSSTICNVGGGGGDSGDGLSTVIDCEIMIVMLYSEYKSKTFTCVII